MRPLTPYDMAMASLLGILLLGIVAAAACYWAGRRREVQRETEQHGD